MSDRRGIVIGTAGHVDHGKTALVRALTGVETDRWLEERKRGLTIDLGFARLDLDPDLETGIVDVPGHEDFLKNMLAGATGIDVLLLVVAADEGPMPQTHEHLAIARLLNIRRGVVALTKSDRVDEDWLDLAHETTRELLDEDSARASWEIVPVSALTGDGIEPLREALRRSMAGIRARGVDDRFRLPVEPRPQRGLEGRPPLPRGQRRPPEREAGGQEPSHPATRHAAREGRERHHPDGDQGRSQATHGQRDPGAHRRPDQQRHRRQGRRNRHGPCPCKNRGGAHAPGRRQRAGAASQNLRSPRPPHVAAVASARERPRWGDPAESPDLPGPGHTLDELSDTPGTATRHVSCYSVLSTSHTRGCRRS